MRRPTRILAPLASIGVLVILGLTYWNRDHLLLSSAIANRLGAAKLILLIGADVNARDVAGATPLTWAVHKRDMDMARFLIARGADVNAHLKDVAELTEEEERILQRFPRTLHPYLEVGWRCNGSTPLSIAAHTGDVEIIRLLLDHGATTEQQDKGLETPLTAAVLSKVPTAVGLLLERGANPNAGSFVGSPLCTAAREESLEILRLLLERAGDPRLPGRNPLFCAVDTYRELDLAEHVGLLLHRGAPINERYADDVRDYRGMTPLMFAARNGHRKTVRLLLTQGADAGIADAKGRTVFQLTRDANLLADLFGRGAHIIVDMPEETTDLMGHVITFRWHVVQGIEAKDYRYRVRVDKGAVACDSFIEETFEAGMRTELTVRLSTSHYVEDEIDFAIEARDSRGKTYCREGYSLRINDD